MEANLLGPLVSTAPAQLLIASVWQGLLLTAFAWACLCLASRMRVSLRASTRFTLWLFMFLLVALLPCLAFVRGLPGSHLLPASPAAVSSVNLDPRWAFALEGLWLLTSAYSLLRLGAAVNQMRALLRESTLLPFSSLSTELQTIVRSPGSRPLELRLSSTVDAPSVIGFFRPVVVLPASMWRELSANDLRAIVLHEKAHLDRGDDWTNLLQKLLRSLFPLNPALAWAERSLCREREQACDDAVLEAAGNARAYATCLTKLAETRLVKRAAALAPGLWQRHSELTARVRHILEPRPKTGAWRSRVLVGACLVVVGSSALLLQRCPGLVSFTPGPANAAAPTKLSTSMVVRASYHLPAAAGVPVKPMAVKSVAGRPRPRVHSPFAVTRVQYWQVRSEGDRVTLLLFTVEVPRGSVAPWPFPYNWIDAQI